MRDEQEITEVGPADEFNSHPFQGPSSREFPAILTLLPTYRCTAACENCCFDSGPQVEGRIPLDRLMSYVNQAADLKTIRLVVISGGEAFLLGKDLDALIGHITSLGLSSRIVTNGYWARRPDVAEKRLRRLTAAGLTELNVSNRATTT